MFASRYPNAKLTQPGDVLVTMTPRPGAVIGWDGYKIAGYPVRILRIPPGEAGQFTPRVLCALLFGDGSGTRPAGAVRASGSVDEQRLLLLSPGQVRAFDDLLRSGCDGGPRWLPAGVAATAGRHAATARPDR